MTVMGRTIQLAVACGLLSAAAGCSSSASFRYDRETVWRAAVGEAVIWRPTLIDDQKYVVESVKSDLAGSEQSYRLEVRRNPNPFARRPSTKVHVRMQQTRPKKVRFNRLEKEFLLALEAKLQAMASPPAP
jgi:hypothetical protein